MSPPPSLAPLEYHAENREICTVTAYFQAFHQQGIGVEDLRWTDDLEVGLHIQPHTVLGALIWTRGPAVSLTAPDNCEGTIAWINAHIVEAFLHMESVTVIRLEALP